jgi:hypothetical protein
VKKSPTQEKYQKLGLLASNRLVTRRNQSYNERDRAFSKWYAEKEGDRSIDIFGSTNRSHNQKDSECR